MAFERVYSRCSSELAHLVNELAAGRLAPDQFGDELYKAITSGHIDAYAAGLKHAGSQLDPLQIQHAADKWGKGIVDIENGWLDNFVNDIESGRYTDELGNLNTGAISQRANMYALKTRSSANQGFLDASAANKPDEQFDWLMIGFEHHCSDCPRLAALSPYGANELFTTPGAGDTQCLSHCKCVLRRHSDGLHSFPRP